MAEVKIGNDIGTVEESSDNAMEASTNGEATHSAKIPKLMDISAIYSAPKLMDVRAGQTASSSSSSNAASSSIPIPSTASSGIGQVEPVRGRQGNSHNY